MTQKEQARLQVLNSVLAEHMTTEQAAEILGVSTRHTRRILAAYKEDGAAALAHGNRGRRPHNATSEMEEADVLYLSRTRYEGAKHTHLSELLREREGIDIGRTTLRRILLSAGLSSPRSRRPPRHRVRRQRMPGEGMLIQIDGSYHRWLGEQCPQFTLLLAVDDATGSVVHALFCQKEDTRGYFLLLDGLIQRRGIPLALYTDRHAVFKHTPGAGGVGAPTQFSRAMDELGIHLIFALSPQAKGRVERTAGTFQDRLVTELRLAGVSTIDGANRVLPDFLPRFNERFRVPAQQPDVAYRSLDADLCLDRSLCFKHSRRVARDNTVKYRWHTLQLLPGMERPSYAGAKVEVQEGLDGTLRVQHEGRIIPTQEAPPRPSVLRSFNGASPHTPTPHQGISGAGSHLRDRLASPEAVSVDGHADAPNSGGRVRKAAIISRRKPTPRQRARWQAVQRAKLNGLSIRGIDRELGMHRDTVRRYMAAESPPMMRPRVKSGASQSDTMTNYSDGHFR